jgi:hypothetical protein
VRRWWLASLVASQAALAGPLLSIPKRLDPSEGLGTDDIPYVVNLSVTADHAVGVYEDAARNPFIMDVRLAVWTLDGGVVGPVWGLPLTKGGWREAPGGVACMASGRCVAVDNFTNGPLFGVETRTLDLAELDGGTPPVTFTQVNAYNASVAANVNGFAVAMGRSGGAYVMTFDATGAPTGAAIRISAATSNVNVVVVAGDANTFFVVWQDNTDGLVHGRMIGTAGIPNGNEIVVSGTEPAQGDDVQVSGSGGNGYCVTFRRTGTGRAVEVVRLANDGTVLDTPPLVAATPAADPSEPGSTFTGADWLVHWGAAAGSTPHQQRRLPADAGTGFSSVAAPTPVDEYGLQVQGTNAGLLYAGSIFTWPIGPDGGAGIKWPTLKGGPTQYLVKAAAVDGGVIIVWDDDRNVQHAPLGALVDRRGMVTPVPGPPPYRVGPGVGSLDGDAVMAWESSPRIQAARASAPSTLLLNVALPAGDVGPEGIVSGPSPTGLVFAFTDRSAVYTAAVLRDGGSTPLSTVAAAGPTRQVGGLAFSGDAGLLVYSTVAAPMDELWVLPIDAEGVPTGPARGPLLSVQPYGTAPPSIASSGAELLVLWDVVQSNHYTHALWAMSFAASDGSSDGGFSVATRDTYGYPGETALAWDGTQYFVAWIAGSADAGDVDLFGLRLGPGGVLIDGPFVMSATPASPSYPAVGSPREGEFVIGWSESDFGGAPPRPARAMFARWLSLPVGEFCTADNECSSASCTAGACAADAGNLDAGGLGGGAGGGGAGGGAANGGGAAGSGAAGGSEKAFRLNCGCEASTQGLAAALFAALALRRRRQDRKGRG